MSLLTFVPVIPMLFSSPLLHVNKPWNVEEDKLLWNELWRVMEHVQIKRFFYLTLLGLSVAGGMIMMGVFDYSMLDYYLVGWSFFSYGGVAQAAWLVW